MQEPEKQEGAPGAGKLAAGAFAGTLQVAAGLFIGWFVAFALMGVIGHSLLVGMYYLAWPIVFPIVATPAVFALLFVLLWQRPDGGPRTLVQRRFQLRVMLPLVLLGVLVMLATCPLDIGGTLLTRGREAFS